MELKLCPFCGSELKTDKDNIIGWCGKLGCFLNTIGAIIDLKDKYHLTQWNKRPIETELAEQIELLKGSE